MKKARLRINKHGTAVLALDTVRLDLSHAETSDHRLDVQLVSGSYDRTDSRLWNATRGKLRASR